MLAHQPARRHDLDALRAVAMLLGIVLHASLAYVPGVRWPVHDTQTTPALGVIAVVIHGFRMPLFFLLSGYFTALLWRSRGCVATLRQRFIRVFIPLLVASATLVPLFNALGSRAAQRPRITPATSGPEESPLVRAIRGRDPAAVANAISTGIDIDLRDPEFGIPPITLAAIVGEPEVVRLLLDAGADPDELGQDGRTPLHGAAFAGRIDAAALLLDRGAAAAPRSPQGDTPLDSARADEATTAALAGLLRIGLDDSESLAQRRAAIVKLLARRASIDAGSPPALGTVGWLARARDAYRAWLLSPRWTMTWLPGLQPQSLVLGNAFNYLWFLWFLCWFTAGFACVAALGTWLRIPRPPPWLVISPAALLWTIPATLSTQLFMGPFRPVFGPDTSASLLPQPHVLGYYSVFFASGALASYASDDERVGRWWPLTLVASLVIVLPAGLVTMSEPLLTALPQALFTWLMCWSTLGFFRWLVPKENPVWRYVSDSAYWLYLAHPPLLILLQQATRDWPLPAPIKFFAVCLTATGLLLVSYQVFVRHTPLGLLLNGGRGRRCVTAATAGAVFPTAMPGGPCRTVPFSGSSGGRGQNSSDTSFPCGTGAGGCRTESHGRRCP